MINELKFNHFGLAVRDKSKAETFLNNLGYKWKKEVDDMNQNIKAGIMFHPLYFDIEIISKIRSEDKTPIDNLIKNNSSALYHICFECTNINKLEIEMKEKNLLFREIVKKIYSPLFERDISFYYSDSIGIIEILHV